ncbi:hypothetical protein [Candidatus Cryosericum odellii]|uniref:hypothetical protein n=1 Tax=Candidatus Cryosericum odellii TaxID=2290917 RepID=UPI000F89BD3F|nr:hypothetical protein [Candidatus Cryosericum odellii]
MRVNNSERRGTNRVSAPDTPFSVRTSARQEGEPAASVPANRTTMGLPSGATRLRTCSMSVSSSTNPSVSERIATHGQVNPEGVEEGFSV